MSTRTRHSGRFWWFTRAIAAALAVLLLAACNPPPVSDSPQETGGSSEQVQEFAPLPRPRPISLSAAAIMSCGWGANDKSIHLTFDDFGPPARVNALLDYLEAKNVRVTFFATGEWADTPEGLKLVGRMINDGHLLGNHTRSHAKLTAKGMTTAKIKAEIAGGVKGNVKAPLMRPPFGSGAFTPRIQKIIKGMGYQPCYWDVDSRDWAKGITTAQIVKRVMHGQNSGDASLRQRALRPGDVVLMHMHGIHTLAAVKLIIAQSRAKGWEFDPLHTP